MAGFFELNTVIVTFLYGMIFFLLGFGIFLKNKQHSRFKLVKSLKWLAVFSILHAIGDWGHLFIPFQKEYSSLELYFALKTLRIMINTISFVFLLQFGLSLLINAKKLPDQLKILPTTLFLLWFFQFIFNQTYFPVDESELWWVRVSDIWSRYLFAFPGAMLACYGIYIQKEEFKAFGYERFIVVLKFTSFSFFIYGIAAGFIVPEGPVLLAQFINSELFFTVTGIPIELVRATSGIFITFLVLKLIQVFDQEYLDRLRESQKEKAIFEERNRFAQDLHDGIIQSMYAMNLQLDVVRHLFDQNPSLAKEKLDNCLEKRNAIIEQIRGYIGELRRTTDKSKSLKKRVLEIIEELDLYEITDFKFNYDYEGYEIPLKMNYHISHIIKEAITNVIKHAKATSLKVDINGKDGLLYIEIEDDGIGFSTSAVLSTENRGSTQGLKNIKERVHAVNGQIKIKSVKNQGTNLFIKVPIEGDETENG